MAEGRFDIRFGVAGHQGVMNALSGIIGRFGSFGGLLGRLSTALVAVAGPTALGMATKRAIDAADALGKLAQGAGVAVEELSALSLPAELAGISNEILAKALGKLSDDMLRAGQGSGSLADELLRLSDQFASMPDGPAKTAEAIRIFGERMGQQMIPLLNQGSEAIREQIEEAKELGLVVGPEFSRNAERFNDNLTRMKRLGEGVFLRLADAILPLLNENLEYFLDLLKQLSLDTRIVEAFALAWNTVKTTIESAALAVEKIRSGVGFLATLKQYFSGQLAEEMGEAEDAAEGFAKSLEKSNREAAQLLSKTQELEALLRQDELRRREIQAAPIAFGQKQREEREVMVEQRRRVEELIQTRQAEAPAAGSEFSQDTAKWQAEMLELRAQKAQLDADLEQTSANVATQLRVSMQAMERQIGNTAQIIARNFTTVIQGAIDGISTSISGLIKGTMTWADALRNIGTTILDSVINAIARMFAEWIVGRLMVKGIEIAASKAEAVAKAPAAMMTSVQTSGAAAIAGMAAFVAAIALAAAAIGGAFAEGGYTGPGNTYEVAGWVHRGEYVMPAETVARVGLPALESVRQGEPAAIQAAQSQGMNVAIFDDRARLKSWLRSREGKAAILEIVGKYQHEIL